MSSNEATIASYDAHVPEYVRGTTAVVSNEIKVWIDANLDQLNLDAHILELGSGAGRDANYMESRGFKVERSDATAAFVTLLRKQVPDTRQLNALTDELGSAYDMIFANAVLLHFTDDEAAQVCEKVYDALSPNGRFAFSLKRGDGEEWTEGKLDAPRYFNYWQPEGISNLLQKVGFVQIDVTDDGTPKWLMIDAVKEGAS